MSNTFKNQGVPAGVAHSYKEPSDARGEVSSNGHRKRLLERYLKAGLSGFHDHEMVELLLTFVIPRKDTKPIARELLNRYGTISKIVNMPAADLAVVKGLGLRSAALLTLIRDVMAVCLQQRYQQQPVISHRRDVEEYFRFNFGHRREEYVAALFMDSSNHIIQTEILCEGTVNQCAVYPRTVMERAMKCGAASYILAHNHPGGGLNPSEADWLITERLFTVGKLLEIPLLDHLIISKTQVVSMRELARWPR
ncbi:DNA repair protein RadC [Chitinispirillum alkaliphilum]|nr:DNA repair protein RadC [Chitinispirillum alkaliphilum]